MDDIDVEPVTPIAENESRESVSKRFGNTTFERVESAVWELRALDYRFGGGHCRAALSALLDWGDQLLAGELAQSARNGAYTVVGDMHNLAGWMAFDIGHINAALRHFDRAVELADLGHNCSLAANVFYRIGRVHLHHHAPERALEAFERGLAAISDAESPLAASILRANQAWAYASTNALGPALTCLGQARDEFARTNFAEAPTWARFFGETDLAAMTGVVYTELARGVDRRYAAFAVPALEDARDGYQADMARSKVFVLAALATNRLVEGDIGAGIQDADAAMELAATVTSVRVRDRMGPLRAEIGQRCLHSDSEDLRALARRTAIFVNRPPASYSGATSQVATVLSDA